MDDENVKLILEKLDAFEKRLDAQDKKVTDVTTFNRELLNKREVNLGGISPEQRHEQLHKQLMEGIKH